jgi:CRISPR-associated exonuclease Cas4
MIDYLLNLIFEKYLREDSREHKVGVYYPSEMGFCVRRNYFMYKNPKPIPIKTLLLFQSGIVAHEWLANVLSKIKEVGNVALEVIPEGEVKYQVDENILISGKFDELLHIKFKENDKTYDTLIELKTVRDLKAIREPKLHHYMQINFYLKMLNIKDGYIMYLDRKDYNYKLFNVELNEALFKLLIDRVRYLHWSIVYDQTPIPEGIKTKWQCHYCDYREECFNILTEGR